ncbi:cytochrome P450 [Streptomyces aidingensis]|uniref:Cytochrome P450 n=1 Tax=Streptomyces aidingensis TaxID=910347 RepID=A0A1I1FRG7_9ACTN|nr:cytochrome P450 [Streptomyces aidingensis]SFC01934.1 Cytochrome P450 [Streptomyces aidingensis]
MTGPDAGPAGGGPPAEPLYTPEFAADPGAVYARLRKLGPAAPVELAPGVPATLVTGYAEALHVLRSPELFVKDPRRWPALRDGTVPPVSPVGLTLSHRPHCYTADGPEHLRLRQVIGDALDRLDPGTLRAVVEEQAGGLIDALIGRAAGSGGRADLLADYAVPLSALVFDRIAGCPPAHAARLQEAAAELLVTHRQGGDPAAGEAAWAALLARIRELIAERRRRPGADLLSWMAEHPADLTDTELAHQFMLLASFAVPPQHNLIAAALRLLLAGDGLPVAEAVEEALWTDSPLAGRAVYFPVRDVPMGETVLPAGRPVVVGIAAANAELAPEPERRRGNRAHLSWGAGPHGCPARGPARLIATVAAETLLERLPDLALAVPAEELRWLPGPFFRALAALPVTGIPAAPPPGPRPAAATASPPDGGPGQPGRPGLSGETGESGRGGGDQPAGARFAVTRKPTALARMQAALAQWWRGE